MSLDLSIVIPAYNEVRRLPQTLDRLIPYLQAHSSRSFEVIVVDDGSSDGTPDVVEAYARRYGQLKLVRMPYNQGRGAVVKRGVLEASGALILETDADGSVGEEAVLRFADFLDRHPSVDGLTGSRNVEGAEILTPQPWLRVFLGYGFLYAAKLLFGWDIADYTLGFKMLRAGAARDIFSVLDESGFIGEAEVLVAARCRGWRILELPVAWTDFCESRVQPGRDSLRSLAGLYRMAMKAYGGAYRGAAGERREPRLAWDEAVAQTQRRYQGLGWPALFCRIRFFTAAYRQIEPLVPRQGIILDLGCGYGIFSNLLALLGAERRIVGLERDAGKLRLADRGLPNASFRVADITNADAGSADCILLIDVLHHLSSYDAQEVLLRDCRDRLKADGRLIVCDVVNLPFWKFWLGRLADALLYPGDRIYYRRPDDFYPLFERLGYSVEALVTHRGTPFAHITYVCGKKD